MDASTAPSVYDVTGGESITTCVKERSKWARTVIICSEPNSSAGFDGWGPAGSRHIPCASCHEIAPSNSVRGSKDVALGEFGRVDPELRIVLRPRVFSRPNARWSLGRLRSASDRKSVV